MIFVAADDLSIRQSGEDVPVVGNDSFLPKELGDPFYNLPIIRHLEKDVSAVAAWDSSIHDNKHLNRVTEGKNRTGNLKMENGKRKVLPFVLYLPLPSGMTGERSRRHVT